MPVELTDLLKGCSKLLIELTADLRWSVMVPDKDAEGLRTYGLALNDAPTPDAVCLKCGRLAGAAAAVAAAVSSTCVGALLARADAASPGRLAATAAAAAAEVLAAGGVCLGRAAELIMQSEKTTC